MRSCSYYLGTFSFAGVPRSSVQRKRDSVAYTLQVGSAYREVVSQLYLANLVATMNLPAASR